MLNMQNVKDIEITEGNVRTIHDKDSRLIWGRLAYDTKYAGDTYQQTYSGKNLFDYNANRYEWHASVVATSELYSVECTAPQSSYVFILVPNSSDLLGKTATLCAKDVASNTSGRGGRIVIYQSSSSSLSSISSTAILNINGTGELKDTFTFPNTFDTGKDCFVVGLYAANVYSGVQAGEKTTYKYLQLEVNSASTNFEPYTGGIPAPNPDYPQDVQVVSGEQTVTISDGGGQSATYKVDLTGKNIIDGSYDRITSFTRCTGEKSGNGFKITSTGQSGAVYATIPVPNYNEFLEKTVTLSYDGIGSNVNVSCYYLASDGKTPSSSYLSNISSGTSFTFPSSIPAGSTGVCLVFYSSVNNNTTYNNIQLELGSSPTPYEPHYDYELCKIGDYQDYIYKSGDDWYVHKECGKVVFDGTEAWNGGTSTGSPTYLYAYTVDLDSLNLYSARQAFCSHFSIWPNQLATGTEVSYPCLSVVTPTAATYAHIRLMIPLAIAANTNALRTWLGSHNTNLYYVLATSTDTKITDATLIGQLNAVHEWLTRYGYSSNVTGNLPLIINQTNL